MNVYRRFLAILRHRGEELLLYEIIIRTIGIVIGGIVAFAVRNYIQVKVVMLSEQVNVSEWAQMPYLAIFAICVFFLLYLSVIEIVGLCHIAHSWDMKEKPSLVATLRFASKKALNLLHAYGLTAILVIFLGLILFPVFGIGLDLFRVIQLPTSVAEGAWAAQLSQIFSLAFTSVMTVVLIYVAYRFIFTFHLFSSNQYSLLRSAKESWKLTRRHKSIHELFGWGVIVPIVICIVLFIGTVGLFLVIVGLLNSFLGLMFSVLPAYLSIMLYASWVYILTALLSVMIAPSVVAALCAFLEMRFPQALGYASSKQFEHIAEHQKGWKILHRKKTVFIIGLIGFIIFAFIARMNLHILQGSKETPVTIAHRGLGGLENSIASFEAALANGADGIETDLQMLRDGTIVLFHDEFIKPIASPQPIALRDFTLKQLNDARIPIATLDELTEVMKRYTVDHGLCNWLLEIKSYGGDVQSLRIGEVLYKKLQDANLLSCSYIGSFDISALRELEMKHSDIRSNIYILGRPAGSIDLGIFDAMSVEQSIVTQSFVRDAKIKNPQSKLFVWTVNTPNAIEGISVLGVTGVITDDAIEIKQAILRHGAMFNESQDDQIISLFGKTFIINPAALWQFKFRYSLF